MSNKKSSEFNFYEAALVKRTDLFRNCENVVVGKEINRKVYNAISPGRYEDGKCEFWKKIV